MNFEVDNLTICIRHKLPTFQHDVGYKLTPWSFEEQSYQFIGTITISSGTSQHKEVVRHIFIHISLLKR